MSRLIYSSHQIVLSQNFLETAQLYAAKLYVENLDFTATTYITLFNVTHISILNFLSSTHFTMNIY
jgi:hypothetical protein